MSANSDLGTALVTGASAGIGATYADRLARRGYDVLLVARDAARLKELAARLSKQYAVKAEVLAADLSDTADLRKVEKRLREDATISLLVNNAGIGPKGKALADDIDYLDAMVALNVTAANRLAVAAAQVFAARGSGSIVNIASAVAIVPEAFNGTYSATKAFVLALTQSLAVELADKGVQHPGGAAGLHPHRDFRPRRWFLRRSGPGARHGRRGPRRCGSRRPRPRRTGHHSVALGHRAFRCA